MNGANGMSDIEGKAARVAASECGQRASFKMICARGPRKLRFVSFGCFQLFRKPRRHKCLASNYCDVEHPLGQIIAKRIALAANQNSLLSAAILCAKSKRLRTGSNCSWRRRSFLL